MSAAGLHKMESRKSQRSVLSSVSPFVSGHARASTESATMDDGSSSSSSYPNGSANGSGHDGRSRPSLLTRAKSRATRKRPLSYVPTSVSSLLADPDPESFSDKELKGFNGVFPQPEEGCLPKLPARLTEEQQHKYQQILEHFQGVKEYPIVLPDKRATGKAAETRAPSEWEKMRMLTRDSMLRYLRAAKWDVEVAKKRLTDTIAWRREYGVDSISPEEVEPEAKCGKETVLGFDRHCRPLHYMHPHRNDTEESPRQMRFAVWILEACIDMMPPGVEQLALLINFEHKSRNPTSISNAKLMLYILQNHYVERLGIALCINVPWIFKAFYNAVQSFIDPNTKAKVKFDASIKDEVPLAQLSGDFGGQLDFTYDHTAYWPDLVRVIKERREQMLSRFLEKCNGEIGAAEWVIRGGEDYADAPLSKETGKEPTKEIVPESLLTGGAAADASADAVAQTPTLMAAQAPGSSGADQEGRQQAIEAPQMRETLSASVSAACITELATLSATVGSTTKANGHAQQASGDERADGGANLAAAGTADAHVATLGENRGMSELDRTSSVVMSGGEVFATPSTTLSDNPLERQFSIATTTGTREDVQLESTIEEPATIIGDAMVVASGISPSPSISVAATPETPKNSKHPFMEKLTKRSSTSPSKENKKNKHDKDDSVSSVPDPETPRDARHCLGHEHDDAQHHSGQFKDGFQDFVRGGSHFFKNLKAGVAGVGLGHAGGHHYKRADSRNISAASTVVGEDDKKPRPPSSSLHTSSPRKQGSADSQKTFPMANGHAHGADVNAAEGAGAVGVATVSASKINGHAHEPNSAEEDSSATVAAAPLSGKTVKVLYFAGARAAIKKSEEDVELPETPFALAQLTAMLVKKHEKEDLLGDFERTVKASKWSVDEEMVDVEHAASTMLNGGEEVAVIPPVSGG
ncbi:hypothetical protein K437DRAFT_254528 [Tilletiaria anomala UBC 951]|uniref:CRAL-TRIO domain-containing protein n=1 Tax=Tilletiaria anomala (strain ATCC 24038 / CBS 436.72 / UBC 951) TaxID=1037660 RepID=A0A066WDX0_TILAU|nr:uncharacterized protein K437DRAFT_254528 [Tilletiaria anomala UBC 951]KDN52152.1 hypothetical protein K437DRAFT_254528 [Tilletiaria anomala UBC 951]